MVQKVYSIYDLKAKYYLRVVQLKEDAEASRMFGDVCKDEKTLIGSHPEDFKLYRIGEFDDNTGVLTPEKIPVLIAG